VVLPVADNPIDAHGNVPTRDGGDVRRVQRAEIWPREIPLELDKASDAYFVLASVEIVSRDGAKRVGRLLAPLYLRLLWIMSELDLCQNRLRLIARFVGTELLRRPYQEAPGATVMAILRDPCAAHLVAAASKTEPKASQVFIPENPIVLAVQQLQTRDSLGVELHEDPPVWEARGKLPAGFP
jgi:hypothetical protein